MLLSYLKNQKNILVCPLDWGLGHASRMVIVIEMLISKGANVIIGADKGPLEFLKKRFENCEFVKFPGFEAKYPKGKAMALKMALQFPKMKRQAKKANILLQEIIKEKKINIVISDNRYELFSSKVYSVLLTHQLNIHTIGLQKLFAPFIKSQLNNYIKKFDELWIPDFEKPPWLSGKLSHGKKIPIDNYFFIGPLSRFKDVNNKENLKKYDVMAILSGPEPQRSIFEEILEKQFLKTNLKIVFLLGMPGKETISTHGNIVKISHLSDTEFAQTIMSSDLIISRPGYSTIMDLAVFGKNAIFVPTPGQTEQEYLAKELERQGSYYFQAQDKLDISLALKNSEGYKGLRVTNDYEVLNERINYLLKN